MFTLGLVSLMLLAGCSTGSVVPESRDARLAQASNDLAFDLLKSTKNDKNVFISPFSISTALAMLYRGSDGTTAESMRKVLGYAKYNLSDQDVDESYQSLLSRFKQAKQNYQLSTYNGLLVQKDLHVRQDYGNALKSYYSAEAESVDFANSSEQVKSKVNGIVEGATNGKIQNFLDQPPSSDTKLFLLSAVYFLGNWQNPFSSNFTYERTFYNNGVKEKKVPMMHRDASYKYAISDELSVSAVVLPYKGENAASMIVLLPDEGKDIKDVQQKLSQEALDRILDTATERRLQLIMPKYSLSYGTNLVNVLADLGMEEIFSDRANLTRMVEDDADLKVGRVTHKAAIDVNERGSEAAAATGIEIIPLSIPPAFNVNIPFLFFIRDESTGVILFSGKVNEL